MGNVLDYAVRRLALGVRRFAVERGGTVAMTFALASIPVFFLIGAAIDYARATTLQVGIQASVDATTLSLCRSTSTSTSDLQATAATMLAAYSPTVPVTIDTLSVTSAPRTVTLAARATYTTAFAALMNVTSFPVAARASCATGDTSYEIALVLDTTGSMANSGGGTSKIQALRAAATTFVNTMFASIDTTRLKIALVPFAASVKIDPVSFANASWLDQAGKSSLHWQNVTGASGAGFTSRFGIFKKLAQSYSGWSWAGCLESLPYPLNVRDGAPTSANADSAYVPLFAPDEFGNVADAASLTGANSYMDDGSTQGSGLGSAIDALLGINNSCDRFASAAAQRMGQACKYNAPKNIDTNQDGPNGMCTSRALTRLTNTKTTLLSEIANLTAAGSTNIHEGVMWGWRALSPNSVLADGAAYATASSTTRVVKIVVVMSDGANTWQAAPATPVTRSQYSAYGYFTNADGSTPNVRLPPANANPTTSNAGRAAIDALTAEACTNAKAAGVTIYSVGFSVASDPIDAAGQALLSGCASTSATSFLATDSTALNTAFAAIAQGIGQLRLTR